MVPALEVGVSIGNCLKERSDVMATHRDAVARAANKAQLKSGCWVKGGENLFVSFGINHNIGEAWHAGCVECVASKACVQHFDCDLLYA